MWCRRQLVKIYVASLTIVYVIIFLTNVKNKQDEKSPVLPLEPPKSNLKPLPSNTTKHSKTTQHNVTRTDVTKDNKIQHHDYIQLSYRPEFNTSAQGKPFTVDLGLLMDLGLIRKKYINLTEENVGNFVFATAGDRNFFEMVKSTVSSIQKYKPGYKIYFWDLGMSEHQLIQISSWCDVIYRKFNFDVFPPHVRRLRTYAWKPLAIAMTLSEQAGVYWLDSSGRVKTSNFTVLLKEVLATSALSLTSTGHSVYAVTHPHMYRYLPGDKRAFMREEQLEGTFLFYATKPFISRILRWVVLCALQKHCMAPEGSTVHCRFHPTDRFNHYAKCHRYDQSAFSITMLNHFNRSSWSYYSRQRTVSIQRYPLSERSVQECYDEQ